MADAVTITPETGDSTLIVNPPPTFTAPPSNKLIVFSYALATASGMQKITGVGFKPSLLQLKVGLSAGNIYATDGWTDGVTQTCLQWISPNVYAQTGFVGVAAQTGADYQVANFFSFDPDGFTLQWTRQGNPTVAETLIAVCFR